MRTKYDEYSEETEEYSNAINLKKAISTDRVGKAGLRDKLVFGRAAWSEALGYFAILQTMVIFMGLLDRVIININAGIWDLGIMLGITSPYQFPVNIASYAAIAFIVFIMCFGIVGYRHWGLPKRLQELGVKMSPAYFMLWCKFKELEKQNNETNELLKQLLNQPK